MSDDATREVLVDILAELKEIRNKKPGWWDRLPAISTFLSSVIIGGTGLVFSHCYEDAQARRNDLQEAADKEVRMSEARLLELQTIEKFMTYLTGTREKEKEVALLVITTLGNTEFATQFAKLNPSEGTLAAGDKIMRTGETPNQGELPQAVTTDSVIRQPQVGVAPIVRKSGWVYLGHFDAEKRTWETKYFDFATNVDPAKLQTVTLNVSRVTGAINVRAGMPSVFGNFERVQAVLKPPSQVIVRSIKEWSSTGYMWAEIEY